MNGNKKSEIEDLKKEIQQLRKEVGSISEIVKFYDVRNLDASYHPEFHPLMEDITEVIKQHDIPLSFAIDSLRVLARILPKDFHVNSAEGDTKTYKQLIARLGESYCNQNGTN